MNKSGSNNSGAIDADEAARRAERSLELGDPIGALNWVSLRTEPAALAFVGSALARLQDWVGTRRALRKASQGYGLENPTAQARCDIALAEVALVSRELGHDEGPLVAAIEHLESRGDGPNAQYGRLVLARYRVLLGRIDGAIAAPCPIRPTGDHGPTGQCWCDAA